MVGLVHANWATVRLTCRARTVTLQRERERLQLGIVQ
jgi:hypothetical protein